MSCFATKITSDTLGWTLVHMFPCKVWLIAVVISIALHHILPPPPPPPPPPRVNPRPWYMPLPRERPFLNAPCFFPTGLDFIWIALPADSWVPVILDVATYVFEYLSPCSYKRTSLYTSSGVLVDRHSSFCASRLFMYNEQVPEDSIF